MLHTIPIYSENIVVDADGRIRYVPCEEFMTLDVADDGSISVKEKPDWVHDGLVERYINHFLCYDKEAMH